MGSGVSYAIPTNSLDAHRVVHLAPSHGLEDRAEERLFAAHFTEGRSIGDQATLRELGADFGLDPDQVTAMLAGDDYRAEVRREGEEAHAIGVTGVPFFLFNRKYAIAGAQPIELFAKTLRTARNDHETATEAIN